MKKALTKRSGKSPYQRHGKSPYRYSSEYHAWRAALKTGKPSAIAAASREHSRKYAPKEDVK